MRGLWKYQDAGLLDKTHLRFFTLLSVGELFEKAGFRIIDIRIRSIPDDSHKKFLQIIEPVLEQLNIDKKIFDKTTKAFQYIVVAKT